MCVLCGGGDGASQWFSSLHQYSPRHFTIAEGSSITLSAFIVGGIQHTDYGVMQKVYFWWPTIPRVHYIRVQV